MVLRWAAVRTLCRPLQWLTASADCRCQRPQAHVSSGCAHFVSVALPRRCRAARAAPTSRHRANARAIGALLTFWTAHLGG